MTPALTPAWRLCPTFGTWIRTEPAEPTGWPQSRFYSVFDRHAKTLSEADLEATLAADQFNRSTQP